MKSFIIALLALTACYSDPVAKVSTDNADVKVELLFTNDGCKVYRFRDGVGSYLHYYADCGGTMTIQQSGKTTFEDEVPLVRPKR